MPLFKTDAFHALADPTRRRILELLIPGECRVSDLATYFKMSQPAVSQHLGVLRRARLLNAKRHGRERFYRIRPEGLRPVYDWIATYEQFWTSKLDALDRHLDQNK